MTKKKIISICIEPETYKLAKERGLNISNECENALSKILHNNVGQKEEERICATCGAIGGEMYWLSNYEQWICIKCDKAESQKIIVGVVPA